MSSCRDRFGSASPALGGFYGVRRTGEPTPWRGARRTDSRPAGAWTAPVSGRAGRGRRSASTNEVVNLVGDALGRVALGHVVGPGVVDQPLGQARRQHQVAVGDADEAVAKGVEPCSRSRAPPRSLCAPRARPTRPPPRARPTPRARAPRPQAHRAYAHRNVGLVGLVAHGTHRMPTVNATRLGTSLRFTCRLCIVSRYTIYYLRNRSPHAKSEPCAHPE